MKNFICLIRYIYVWCYYPSCYSSSFGFNLSFVPFISIFVPFLLFLYLHVITGELYARYVSRQKYKQIQHNQRDSFDQMEIFCYFFSCYFQHFNKWNAQKKEQKLLQRFQIWTKWMNKWKKEVEIKNANNFFCTLKHFFLLLSECQIRWKYSSWYYWSSTFLFAMLAWHRFYNFSSVFKIFYFVAVECATVTRHEWSNFKNL